jgi:tetratricopeptide (TPR) repeat protein
MTRRMSARRLIGALLLSVALLSPVPTLAGNCQISRIVEFPVTMSNLRPWATARVNDTDATFLVDSGAFYSLLSGAYAAQLGLSTYHARRGDLLVGGVLGGGESTSIARVNTFTLANVSLHDIEFVVLDPAPLGNTGLLGQNILHMGDVEYDLGHGAVRLMRVKDCDKALLAYWVGAGDSYSVMNIEKTSPVKPWTIGAVSVNGAPIRALFDTGAGVSVLSLKTAASVGITPDSPGVQSGGPISGLGGGTVASYIARFSTFKIGDEEIRNPKLRIAAIALPNADMLIGPDFFQSHHIYVANSQRKLYFTYNGGPVFNVSQLDSSSSELGASPPTPDAEAAHSSEQGTVDAAEYARRALGLASRNDFSGALVALGQAIEINPAKPEYFYQRANVWLQLGNPSSALPDFDQAVKLKPDYVAALLARSALYFRKGDKPNAVADLDTAGRSLPPEADARLAMADAYRRAGELASEVTQLNLWVTAHPADQRLIGALTLRCRTRTQMNVDLRLAHEDCDRALRRADEIKTRLSSWSVSPGFGEIYESLALVDLRMGENHSAISEFSMSLKSDAKKVWSLYGRGVAEMRLHEIPQGRADIDQAIALAPHIAEEFTAIGIAP